MDEITNDHPLAYLQKLAATGGYTLREPSLLTVQNAELLRLALGDGRQEQLAKLEPEEVLDHVNAYLFIQAAPIPRVVAALRAFQRQRRETSHEETWEAFMAEQVTPFLDELLPQKKL